MPTYSQELVERLQRHYREKHSYEVSQDEAQAYLESLADLYVSVGTQAAERRRLGAPSAALLVILDYLHTQSDDKKD